MYLKLCTTYIHMSEYNNMPHSPLLTWTCCDSGKVLVGLQTYFIQWCSWAFDQWCFGSNGKGQEEAHYQWGQREWIDGHMHISNLHCQANANGLDLDRDREGKCWLPLLERTQKKMQKRITGKYHMGRSMAACMGPPTNSATTARRTSPPITTKPTNPYTIWYAILTLIIP